ncbi:MAG: hypothetical protein M1831_000763 [Alyxoria varia]|nr:MAG: hypothetical protein M1831_000763 [Alyxoria varia]
MSLAMGALPLAASDRTAAREGIGDTGNLVVPDQPAAEKSHDPEKKDDGSPETSSQEDFEKRHQQVHDLAREYTTESTSAAVVDNPFEHEKDPTLDPNSSSFKPRAWAKSLLNLTSRYPDVYKNRTAGFAFQDLSAHGFGRATDYQKSVGNVAFQMFGFLQQLVRGEKGMHRIDILRDLEGVVNQGEMLVVLGPPGSGCSTFLKTISGDTHGYNVDEKSVVNYQGISPKQMHSQFRGEAIYTAEVDVHFPQLSVADTLSFAARARAPRHIPGGLSTTRYADYLRDVIMAVFGISHTKNTKVGNEFIRGVSGGERKRVTIAEAALSGAPLQCWDNSTRGLDSANAIEFCKTLRMSTDLVGTTACVSIYQSPQSAYDIFDKVLLLYKGRQIFFGRTDEAQGYFERMGFRCPDRQTTADFLTSMTSPAERRVRPEFQGRVPRTPDDFAARWKESPERKLLQGEIAQYQSDHPLGGESYEEFKSSRRMQQAKQQRIQSPYTLSYYGQIKLCLRRGFWRLRGDPSLTFTQLFGNFMMAVVIGSIFYDLQPTTYSFFQRGALLFFAILLNAFGSALEIQTLYAQRPIIEKHARYALYHPSCEAIASILTDMPYKIMNSITFNLAIYFLSNLNRQPGNFFFFVLITFTLTLVMSSLFRTIASVSRTLAQALAPTTVLILGIVIYTGFALPIPTMRGWARWIQYVNPVSYGFESLMINEFYGRTFTCSQFVPTGGPYDQADPLARACSAVGATEGAASVDGGAYIASAYQYYHENKWRNFGILMVFLLGLTVTYLTAAELITAKKSKGEVLVFRRGQQPSNLESTDDVEAINRENDALEKMRTEASAVIQEQTAVFHWKDVCYDIKIKSETRRILDHVDGWVRPGTLTALMGVSGAGKTTLLDALAQRTTIGVITGEMLVDGRQRDTSFQRKTGYVQQMDLHLSTSTVREALEFSALLRQRADIPKKEKIAYVDEVIKLLDMKEYADAVVGVPGEGLNVEQRKRLTIGVELAARPQLLLFLDEPTSGLDSQTSWAICDLMERLTQHGTAILCTIHQPSAMLFQRFDRLLFLATGGRTVYFGDIGENSSTMINYFEKNGADPCPRAANPAEWMLEVIGAAPGSHTDTDWNKVWRDSPECAEVHEELDNLKNERPKVTNPASSPDDKLDYREFAAPYSVQLWEMNKRVFEQVWRTPSYIYSKISLCLFSTIFIGFSFYNAGTSSQELQNQMFAIFMVFILFGNLVQQILPNFVAQRALFEVRERPAKTFSWKVFMATNIFVEIPWNALMAVVIFVCFYYPVGLYRNAEADGAVHERGALFFLGVLAFMLFTSTFAHMSVAAIEHAETAANIGQLLFSLTLIFCGVLAGPTSLPGFWIFMYRVSPFTYLVSVMLSTAVANTSVICASNEFVHFQPARPGQQTCAEYLDPYISQAGGYLTAASRDSTTSCEFCALDDTNVFLNQLSIDYSTRWRDFGIMWVYIGVNILLALGLYWLVRVPKKKNKNKKQGKEE